MGTQKRIPTQALLAVVVALACVCISTAQNLRVLRPVDEAASHPDFLKFRSKLQSAVERHDVAAVLAAVHPMIRNGFGGDDGIEEFKDWWHINDKDSKLWNELGAVLKLGGTFDADGGFNAPYIFSRWPGVVDAYEYVAVIGSNVRIRTQPRSDAPTHSSVSYAVLQVDSEASDRDAKGEWTAVKIDGRTAYIANRYIRSPIDYRAHFAYSDGKWRMTFFLAGD